MEEQQIYNFLKRNNLLIEAKEIFETYNNLKKRKSPTLDDLVKEKLMLYSNTSTAPLASLVMLTYNTATIIQHKNIGKWMYFTNQLIRKDFV